MSALGALLPIASAAAVPSSLPAITAAGIASASAASANHRMLLPFISPPRSGCPGRWLHEHRLDPGLQRVVRGLPFVEPPLVPRPVEEQGRRQGSAPERI